MKNTERNWKGKSEKDEVITLRDALKIELDGNHLSNTERLETAYKIDQLNDQIKERF